MPFLCPFQLELHVFSLPWSFLSCLGQRECNNEGYFIFSESRPVCYALQIEVLTCSRLSSGRPKTHFCVYSIYETVSAFLRRLSSLSALLNTEYALIHDSLSSSRVGTTSPIPSSVKHHEWPLPRSCPMSSECQAVGGSLFVSTSSRPQPYHPTLTSE